MNLLNNERAVLAPMAGITGYPFRKIMLEYGAGFCFTEMVSAVGFIRDDEGTKELVYSGSCLDKTGIQIFGNNAAVLAEAAKKASDSGFKLIDINMGCPVKKVIKTGAGSAILKDMALYSKIVKSVRSSIKDSFFTIKIRSGFDECSINFKEIGKIAESEGVDALFFHPRTRSSMFGGKADHLLTAALKMHVAIPVYASGDIFTAGDALEIIRKTGADGIMFARGAIGNPLIFRELEGKGEESGWNCLNVKIKALISLLDEMALFYGKERGHKIIRPHIYGFIKGFKGSKALRSEVNSAKSGKEIKSILNKIITEYEK